MDESDQQAEDLRAAEGAGAPETGEEGRAGGTTRRRREPVDPLLKEALEVLVSGKECGVLDVLSCVLSFTFRGEARTFAMPMDKKACKAIAQTPSWSRHTVSIRAGTELVRAEVLLRGQATRGKKRPRGSAGTAGAAAGAEPIDEGGDPSAAATAASGGITAAAGGVAGADGAREGGEARSRTPTVKTMLQVIAEASTTPCASRDGIESDDDPMLVEGLTVAITYTQAGETVTFEVTEEVDAVAALAGSAAALPEERISELRELVYLPEGSSMAETVKAIKQNATKAARARAREQTKLDAEKEKEAELRLEIAELRSELMELRGATSSSNSAASAVAASTAGLLGAAALVPAAAS